MAPEAPARSETWKRALRALFLIAGIAMLVVLIRGAGPERVLETVIGAAAWMPLVIAFDLGFFACEAMAHRAVLGPRRTEIPWSRFVRSSFLYYCVLAIAPLGRAGAEVARAASFAPWVGGGRAAAAAANVQGGVLIANLVISVPCWIAVSSTVGVDHPLAWLLALNGIGTGIAGAFTLLIVRRSRVGTWLGTRFPRLAKMGAELDDAVVAPRRDLIVATAWCCAARIVQIGMYASLLAAIGASVTLGGTLVALGVHLVGAGFGDFVPNQIGILEGAYRIFADAVGLAHDPARAISIALLARVAQFVIAGSGMLALAMWRRDAAVVSAPS
ncbi:lysylphosphatidylglycerol synthase domain-containing protein [Sandaracinus amylolyticus]|uniref:Flippase-like domain-containing protein n=1 Tax=Sandaracinus amylolyticus TaxID=927083 RepID=A0A0F6W7Q1_9BACT|nr:lysylphosphatidylglycerol synthase domain-containing protein [Sandaracinus amylolyticus]AKF09548.1 hypothetical protein DB32_006697 [Sandaracinus amylolyticus]